MPLNLLCLTATVNLPDLFQKQYATRYSMIVNKTRLRNAVPLRVDQGLLLDAQYMFLYTHK